MKVTCAWHVSRTRASAYLGEPFAIGAPGPVRRPFLRRSSRYRSAWSQRRMLVWRLEISRPEAVAMLQHSRSSRLGAPWRPSRGAPDRTFGRRFAVPAGRLRAARPQTRLRPRRLAGSHRSPAARSRPTGGKLASVPSCWATRTSLALTEIAMPTTMAQPANRGAKRNRARSTGPWWNTAEATTGLANSRTAARKRPNTV